MLNNEKDQTDIIPQLRGKEKIEQELMAQIPYEKRKALAKKLMDIFYNPPTDKSSNRSSKRSKKN
jgi:hypothetical protein